MAKIISYDPFIIKGKIGDKVYYVRNGHQFFRGLGVRKKRIEGSPLSPQQLKFSLLTRLLVPLVPLFRESFALPGRTQSGFNKAMSINLRLAISGTYPEYMPDYSKMILGDGWITSPRSLIVSGTEIGRLQFEWKATKGRGKLKAKDAVYVAVYCEALNKWFYAIQEEVAIKGNLNVNIPAFSGYSVHAWFGFISNCEASPSEYGGLVEVW
jgi:hypothetical protein